LIKFIPLEMILFGKVLGNGVAPSSWRAKFWMVNSSRASLSLACEILSFSFTGLVLVSIFEEYSCFVAVEGNSYIVVVALISNGKNEDFGTKCFYCFAEDNFLKLP
jgi:hypothetical protein